MAHFALVHSPFLGPSSWRPLARALATLGHDAVAVDYGGGGGFRCHRQAAERVAAELLGAPSSSTLVVHSGAGALAPAIVDAGAGSVSSIVFVDAILPSPGRSWLETAPADLSRRVRRLTTGGRVPPWNLWFQEDPGRRLIPDSHQLSELLEDIPSVPLAFLEAPAPAADGWSRLPAAYLQLSEAYDPEAAEAGRRGWPVERVALHHLAIVTQADTVADRLVETLKRLETA